MRAPVDLVNTATVEFTHDTYWVEHTAPLGSGGALCTVKPSEALPRPSKLNQAVGASEAGANAAVLWWTVSVWSGVLRPGGSGIRRAGSASFGCWSVAASGTGAALIKSLSGQEKSLLILCRTNVTASVVFGAFATSSAPRRATNEA